MIHLTQPIMVNVTKPIFMNKPDVSIVVPLYNETEIFPELISTLDSVLSKAEFTIQIVLINDGSTDNTEQLIDEKVKSNPINYKGVLLSRNFGHQTAVTAGLENADATKAVMVIDGDLQDPPDLIFPMYNCIQQGFDVVYAVRRKRKEGFFKVSLYNIFYRILFNITNGLIPRDSGDFAMFTVRVNEEMKKMPEKIRFVRGLRAYVGFRQIAFEYDRNARTKGSSKYSFGALLKLASDGIFNFSDRPLRYIMNVGVLISSFGILYLGFILFKKYFIGDVIEGFTSMAILLVLFSGVQLISLGFIAEYISRIYVEAKNRPSYIVKEIIGSSFDQDNQYDK